MDRIIYTAMSGANAAQHRQSVLAHNLANVSTNGFRAELATFRSVPLNGEGSSTRVFSLEATAGYLDLPGTVQNTGRNLDVMAMGKSWFTVQALDGTEAYTRAGALEVSNEGLLVSQSGLAVQGDGGPINIPADSEVLIGVDGTVSAKQPGQQPTVVGRLKLVTPAEDQPLKRGIDGLFRTADEQPLEADATARVATGSLEGSNVNAIETMVGMIAVARQFEAQMKLMQTAETNDQRAAQLLNVQG